jgi:RND superfamily putative drug exporter
VFASLSNVVQSGFVLGAGLLLDTFLLRTVTVPAIAVLVGQANWWRPSASGLAGRWPPRWTRRRERGQAQPAKHKPLLPEPDLAAWTDDEVISFSLHDGLRL